MTKTKPQGRPVTLPGRKQVAFQLQTKHIKALERHRRDIQAATKSEALRSLLEELD